MGFKHHDVSDALKEAAEMLGVRLTDDTDGRTREERARISALRYRAENAREPFRSAAIRELKRMGVDR